MIQIDKELMWEYKRLNSTLNERKREIKLKKIIVKVNPIFLFIIYLIFIDGLRYSISHEKLLLILVIISFWYLFLLSIHYYIYLEEDIENLYNEQLGIEAEIEALNDFCAYLLACRHIESLEKGENLYPDLRENDCKWIIKEYKEEYEEKRIEYEKQHKARLELNKHRISTNEVGSE